MPGIRPSSVRRCTRFSLYIMLLGMMLSVAYIWLTPLPGQSIGLSLTVTFLVTLSIIMTLVALKVTD